jgi:hypothetical protein
MPCAKENFPQAILGVHALSSSPLNYGFFFRIPGKYCSNLNIMGLLYLQSNSINLRGRAFCLLSDDPGAF